MKILGILGIMTHELLLVTMTHYLAHCNAVQCSTMHYINMQCNTVKISYFDIPQIFPNGRPDMTSIAKKERELDFGILSMIILDLEPFNFVSR